MGSGERVHDGGRNPVPLGRRRPVVLEGRQIDLHPLSPPFPDPDREPVEARAGAAGRSPTSGGPRAVGRRLMWSGFCTQAPRELRTGLHIEEILYLDPIQQADPPALPARPPPPAPPAQTAASRVCPRLQRPREVPRMQYSSLVFQNE